ncbi:alkaline phosphatase D family protein [Methylobacterium sp. J-092]|uniref:alkaline phosphatase D family protein n=1 Tax=Methylobacterium sp. J-092 TaxID=2836667 RepID=UPI001FB9FF77|nr:alkaline phosphatase D family protein [Methylobacterium sp. J-092]MCJ2009996.1 alkaline phosphatase D family protein [Methylobacterium sp. J-092]
MVSSRRQLLLTGGAGLVGLASGLARPGFSRAADRPILTHGLQSGDVGSDSAIVWARADRPCRAIVEWSTTESFSEIRGGTVADALPETDGTVKVALTDLPPGQDILYRIRLEDLAAPTIRGPAQVGRFRTAPADRRSVSFCWSGDTAGQGWGIDEARGGMTIYKAMLGNRPDFFLHSGDTIYADGPIAAEVTLPDGTLWRNRVTEAVAKPAETLAEFRGRYKYNLTDSNVLAMNAAVPILAQWDDHEVTNNWWPGEPLTRAEHLRKKYADPNVRALEVRASRAFHEYMPMRFEPAEPGRVYRKIAYGPLVDVFMLDMRSYRGPNGENRETRYGPDSYFLGPVQLAWLKRALAESRATWKVIAADMPLGLVVTYDPERSFGSEAVAQGDGPPLGRELEIADLLRFIKTANIRNTVWLTADVHYTAAHHYDPNKARFQEFEPFWEFVSGPLHAGTFGPNKLDDTFGPQLRFVKAPPEGQVNLSPAAGYQFFGHVAVDGRTEQMTVTLKDAADADLWHFTLDPARG